MSMKFRAEHPDIHRRADMSSSFSFHFMHLKWTKRVTQKSPALR